MKLVEALENVIHLLAGFMAGLAVAAYPIFSLNITILFIAYQAFDRMDEGKGGKVEVIEYMAGLLFGFLIKTLKASLTFS